MQIWILNNFSIWQLIVCSILLCIILSISMYVVLHRYFPAFLAKYFTGDDYFFGILVTSSSVLFAFTIIILWQTLNVAKSTVEDEANALSKMQMNSATFPIEEKKKIKNAVHIYVSTVVQEEWPLMRQGYSSPSATVALEKVYAAIESYRPTGQLDQLFYREVLESFNVVYRARHARLEKLESVIPSSLYSIILFSMFLLLLTGALLSTKEKTSHVTLLVIVSTLIGLNFALITAFNYPFAGEISVSDEPFTSMVH
jgi:hypothetical protein